MLVGKELVGKVSWLAHTLAWLAVSSCCFLASCGGSESANSDVATPGNATSVAGLRLNTLLGSKASDKFLQAKQTRAFSFPLDHLAHTGYQSEWWYLTAIAHDANGREFGVQFTVFRQAFAPVPLGPGPWQTGTAFLAHLAITDVDAQSHRHAQRFSRGHPSLAGVADQPPLHVWIEDWSMRDESADPDKLNLSLRAAGADIAVDLRLNQMHPIVLQGERGLSQKGPGAASFYYSLPRLDLGGSLTIAGEVFTVSGLAWLDREWSTSVLPKSVNGWDWFALQLNDGRSVMAFRLRRRDGIRDDFDHGMWVSAEIDHSAQVVAAGDPGVHGLHPQHFSLQPIRYFEDAAGVRWPVAWRMKIDTAFESSEFIVAAMVDDQVMNTSIVYWEGLVAVSDEQGHDIGRGYMELTGYTNEQ